MKALTIQVAIFLLAFSPHIVMAFQNLPPAGSGITPTVVHLNQDCAATNPDLINCASTMPEMLDWVWTVRSPSAASPLLIDVGPGEFKKFSCTNGGYVTLRGSGRENTTIKGGGIGIFVFECTKLSFQDLTIKGGNYGIQWWYGGSSSYINVHVIGGAAGWADWSNIGGMSVHYWFSSKLESTNESNIGIGPAALFSYGAEHWLYGSEVTFAPVGDNPQSSRSASIVLSDAFNGQPNIRLFGSSVRAFFPPGSETSGNLVGVQVIVGQFHMHGGIINVDASNGQDDNVNAIAILDDPNSTAIAIHTPDTAFAVKAKGTGTAERIAGGTSVSSPYLWPAGSNPPAVSSSKSGEDQFVENDCSVAGDCNNGGNETHLMISNRAKCGDADPWFDTQVGACRAVNTP